VDGQAEDGAGVEGAASADGPAEEPPVPRAAADDVARAERDARPLGRGDEPGQVLGVVRVVAVDRGDELRVRGEGAAEGGHVRGADALLALAVEDVDEVELAGEALGENARSVR
jgi:hypothetical protein